MRITALAIVCLSSLLAACGGGTASTVPEDCEIRVDGECYSSEAEACDAAGCPPERCLILESYPGQVDCQDAPPPPDDGTGDDPVSSDDPAPVPEGGECSAPGQCAEGLFCAGEEGCDATWTCQPMRPCTRDLVMYCGCDGETFEGSGTCPSRPYAHRGACAQ